MKMVIESGVKADAIEALIAALQCETFSEACCIGKIDQDSVYIRLPRAKHGVIFDINAVSPQAIQWVLECLRNSLIAEPSS